MALDAILDGEGGGMPVREKGRGEKGLREGGRERRETARERGGGGRDKRWEFPIFSLSFFFHFF